MGDDRATDKSADNPREAESARASEKLAADSQRTGEISIPPADLSKYNVDRQKLGTTDDYTLYTQYPNGVRMNRFEAEGTLRQGESHQLQAPPGGSVVEIKNGRQVELDDDGHEVDKGAAPKGYAEGTHIVKDASGKVVAHLDPDNTLHVKTARGEYTETSDGRVSFKPSGTATDLESLRQTGNVSKDKFEDYGVSANGNTTRFPNGIEWNRGANKIHIPTEAGNFTSDKETDGNGNLVKVTGRDSNGKVLYIQDAQGFHVPTADGVLTQTGDGKVTFKSNRPVTRQAALPPVEITGR